MVVIREFFTDGDTMWQPCAEEKKLNTTENSRNNPKLDHVSFWDFQDMK